MPSLADLRDKQHTAYPHLRSELQTTERIPHPPTLRYLAQFDTATSFPWNTIFSWCCRLATLPALFNISISSNTPAPRCNSSVQNPRPVKLRAVSVAYTQRKTCLAGGLSQFLRSRYARMTDLGWCSGERDDYKCYQDLDYICAYQCSSFASVEMAPIIHK